jgi:hypothetical protein
MSYEFYKVLHVVGALFLFSSLGTLAALSGADSAGFRRIASIAHGMALGIIFVAGFGLLARLGMFGGIPGWAWAKLVLWGLLGAVVMPLKRRPEWAPALWVVMPLLGGAAAWLAIAKPF